MQSICIGLLGGELQTNLIKCNINHLNFAHCQISSTEVKNVVSGSIVICMHAPHLYFQLVLTPKQQHIIEKASIPDLQSL